MKKKIIRLIKILLNAFLIIIGFIMFVMSLSFIHDYRTNYIEVEATIIEYKNTSDNKSLDSKKSYELLGEELLLGYSYDGRYYETAYTPLISDDYNHMDVGTTTKIKINPQNPQEIIWKLDRTCYISLVLGIFLFIINIVGFYKKMTFKEDAYSEN